MLTLVFRNAARCVRAAATSSTIFLAATSASQQELQPYYALESSSGSCCFFPRSLVKVWYFSFCFLVKHSPNFFLVVTYRAYFRSNFPALNQCCKFYHFNVAGRVLVLFRICGMDHVIDVLL